MKETGTPLVGSTSNVATSSRSKFIKEDVLVLPESTPDNECFIVTEAWKHSDFLCKKYILSGLEDDLYNIYSNAKISTELWYSLEKKYKTEDAGLKKFVAAKFLYYKMVDSKPVITQVQELQVIIHDLLAEGIIRIIASVESINLVTNYEFFIEGLVINEAFQAAAMIEKFPPLWRDFKNYLKHKRKEMKLKDLIVRLRIEEDNKDAKKKTRGNSTIMRANIVETAPTNSKKRKKSSGPNNYPSKKKFKGNYHNYGKVRYKAAEYRAPKKEKKKGQANMVETNDDIGDLEAFASYTPAGPDETIFMGNSATVKMEGYGKIFLKMTSGKVVTLNNVCHIPELRKNLVSISLLVKNGFKCIFISDKIVISKNEMYLGKGYLTEALFKLNLMVVDNNKILVSYYLL
ncbi:uncharacterized protein LOC142168326 [Nicotiana tabacum]|uniref:Uncharacterized protein LOC142168326 n=1 Tax=Nicotiana tabacum TaxID=4097 RepID=A0AC58SJF2_TOBAC